MNTLSPDDRTMPLDMQASATTECPHCGAGLQRAEPGADGRILCLNCGKRFAAAGPAAGQATAPAAAARGGERAGLVPLTYAYLRVLGVVALIAAVGFAIFQFVLEFPSIIPYLSHLEVAMVGANLSMIGLIGAAVLLVTARISRIDARMLALVERRGCARRFEPPKGSALPYIAPGAVLGGLGGVATGMLAADNGNMLHAAFACVLIALGMTLGCACENLRVFLARQRLWGACLSGRAPESLPERVWSLPAICAAAMAGGLGLLSFLSAHRHTLESVLTGCGALLAWTAVLLLRDLGAATRALPAVPALRGPLDRAAIYLPCAWIASFVPMLLLDSFAFRWHVFLYLTLISGGLAALLGALALELTRWRSALHVLLGTRPRTVLKGWALPLVALLACAAAVNAAMWTREILSDRNLRNAVHSITMLIGTIGVPLWTIFFVREVLRADAAAGDALAAAEPRDERE